MFRETDDYFGLKSYCYKYCSIVKKLVETAFKNAYVCKQAAEAVSNDRGL